MRQDDRTITRDGIKIHHSSDYEGMRKSCILAAKTLDMISDYVAPGISTEELDNICHEFMVSNGAVPATLGSVNVKLAPTLKGGPIILIPCELFSQLRVI